MLWAAARVYFFDALGVRTVARVHFHPVAGVDEQRHADFCAGVNGRRLERVGGGIAFDAGLGIRDLAFNMRRQVHVQNVFLFGVEHHLTVQAVFEEIRALIFTLGTATCS